MKLFYGGELFESMIFNRVNIFMTHQSNYAKDRLAIYLFNNLFNFINCWTNLELHSLAPVDMVKKYFELYPLEREPLWTVRISMDHIHF